MAPISTILLGPIINYVASCLIELIKTFLERDAIRSSVHTSGFLMQKKLYTIKSCQHESAVTNGYRLSDSISFLQ
jgi:hypothetical protein